LFFEKAQRVQLNKDLEGEVGDVVGYQELAVSMQSAFDNFDVFFFEVEELQLGVVANEAQVVAVKGSVHRVFVIARFLYVLEKLHEGLLSMIGKQIVAFGNISKLEPEHHIFGIKQLEVRNLVQDKKLDVNQPSELQLVQPEDF
jgi:hypothetical protein